MKNKHPQMYSLNETARREILEQFVARYIDHVSPDSNHSNPGGSTNAGQSSEQRSHDVASEILAIGPIQVEGINIDNPGSNPGPTSDMHEIKVEDNANDDIKPRSDIMVELGEADSEMLLVK